jgi:hypothetical protein
MMFTNGTPVQQVRKIESDEFPVRFLFEISVQIIFIDVRILTFDDHFLQQHAISPDPAGRAVRQQDSCRENEEYEEFISQGMRLLNDECKTYFRKDNAHNGVIYALQISSFLSQSAPAEEMPAGTKTVRGGRNQTCE